MRCRPPSLLAALLVCAAGGFPAAAADPAATPASAPAAVVTAGVAEPSPTLPADDLLVAGGAVVGEILVRATNIFDVEDPKEDRRLFRIANKLHIPTRERVIRGLLLFASGDRYDPRLLEESERILRGTKYLYEAEIYPLRYEGNEVTIQVVTRDVWTLRIGFGYSRSGGENASRIGVRDTNFLGTGRELLARRSSDVDRRSNEVRYVDPNLAGSRVRLRMAYRDNSDGNTHMFALQRPFFALDTRWSAGVELLLDDYERSLYRDGLVIDEFSAEQESVSASWGLSRGRIGRHTRRWMLGITSDETRFFALPGLTQGALPADRKLVYPWIGLHWVGDGYVEMQDFDKIQRVEDLNLGHDLQARLGWSSPSLGADVGRWIANLDYGFGRRIAPRQILLADSHFETRVNRGRAENLRGRLGLRYYLRDLGGHLFFASATYSIGHNLDRDSQLLLGGDSGLRGYPLRYAEGERSVLVTLEQRFYTDWHIARLAHVGAAVFVDVGKVWNAREGSELGVLKDAGFGLRIGSSRSSSASLIHVDVAFPLDGDATIDRVQFLVRSRETF